MESKVFLTMREYYLSSQGGDAARVGKIVHCINPFPAALGSEHEKAQRITLASMTKARKAASVLSPNLNILFANVTSGEEFFSPSIDFDVHRKLSRTVTDLKSFRVPRNLPLVMDILTSVPLEASDVLVFSNVDISLSPSFYSFLEAIFSRGSDCVIINRRTISDVYLDERDLSLMDGEVGAAHPGFDCFAFRGWLRDALEPYDSCVGIGGVMLPLVYQLIAKASDPVVILDAHLTYHLGDDQQWKSDEYSDYREHNRLEIDRIFRSLIVNKAVREEFLSRLSHAHEPWVFPDRLRAVAGMDERRTGSDYMRLRRRVKMMLRSLRWK